MKKRRKGNLLQRMMAVLLSAVLIAGTAYGAFPVNVLAQESSNGNLAETTEVETVTGSNVSDVEESAEKTDEAELAGESAEKAAGGETDEKTEGQPEEETKPADSTENLSGEQNDDLDKAPEDPNAGEEGSEPAGGNGDEGAESDAVIVPKKKVQAAEIAPQAADIATGTDWVLDADGNLTISSDKGMEDWRSKRDKNSRVHPYQDQVISVEMAEGVKKIETDMFYNCTNLVSVEIPSTVTEISSQVFQMCTSLESITIPDSVEAIMSNAFTYCSNLTSVKMLGTTPPYLAYNVFNDTCKFIADGTAGIKVPEGCEEAYKNSWTAVAKYITADDTATDNNIATGTDWVLDADGKLTISSDEGMTDWDDNARSTYRSEVKTVEVQDGVTKIIFNVFSEYRSLTDITLANSVTEIERYAFAGSSSLTNITIPDSVTSIGNSAFFNCSSLDSVTMQGSTPPTIGTDVFERCKFVGEEAATKPIKVPAGCAAAYKAAWTEWEAYIADDEAAGDNLSVSGTDWTLEKGKLTILSDVGMDDWMRSKDIGVAGATEADEIKYYCHHVITAELKSGVTYIKGDRTGGKGAFRECNNMQSIAIPDTVQSIGGRAFENCNKLTEITIPEGVTTIEDYTFNDCSSLENVTIPDSVTSIGSSAFSGCSSLAKLEIPSKVTSIGSSAFSGCSGLTEITIPEGVTSIGNWTFQNCSGLTSIVIPSKVTSIGSGAFKGCSGLTEITIPAGVTEIGQRAFLDCSSLESVTMLGSTPPTLKATTDGNTLHFENCKFVTDKQTGIKVPAGTLETYKSEWTEWADYIEEAGGSGDDIYASGDGWTLDANGKLTIYTDAGMEDWTSNQSYSRLVNVVDIREDVTFIKEGAFSGCSKITEVSIPESVTRIEKRAFDSCRGLTVIDIPAGVESIGMEAFTGSGLTAITIPAGVTEIENNMFVNCKSLKTVIIPDHVTSIGEWVFFGCQALTDVTIGEGVTEIGQQAFSACTSLAEITIPASVGTIGYKAFDQCNALESVTMKGNTPPRLWDGKYLFATCKFVSDKTKGIKVPAGTEETYKTKWPEWADYIEGTTMPDKTDAEKAAAAKKAVEAALAELTVTNATTQEDLQAAIDEAVKTALAAAGIDSGDVTVTVTDFHKTAADADHEGSVTGTVTITAGSEKAEVKVDKTISKLPATPAEQVAAARTAIEEAIRKAIEKLLAGTEVTNDNAAETADQIRDLIPGAVSAALEQAGVSPDDITTGKADITITSADTDNEGSIAITITVTSKTDPGQTDTARVSVPVAKPGTDPGPAKEGIWFRPIPDQTYTGAALKPQMQVYDGKRLLTQGTDYTLTYRNNIKAGTGAKAVIHGKGNYKQKLEAYFTILPKALDASALQVPEYLNCDSGEEQNIKITVRDGKKILNSKNDYTQVITYSGQTVEKAKEAGEYTVTITGKGNYTGTATAVCTLVKDKTPIGDAKVTLKKAALPYNDGEPVTYTDAQVTVKLNNKKIPQKDGGTTNYTVSYENNVQPGTATLVITAGENSPYIGTCRKEFTIKGMPFSAAKIKMEGFVTKTPYTGEPVLQKLTLTDKKSGTVLTENTDYTIAYTNNTNAGKATVAITGTGKYSGAIKKNYTISKVKLTADMVQEKTLTVQHTAGGATPDVTLVYTYDGRQMTLVKDRDYKLSYTNNKGVATGSAKAYITITGTGNFTGRLNRAVELTITPKPWTDRDITVEVPDMKYYSFKSAYTPNPVVRDHGKVLSKGRDYTVTYEANTKADVGDITKKPDGHTAKAVIKVNGSDYTADPDGTDTITAEFRIVGRMLSNARVTVKNAQYFSQSGTWPEKTDLEVRYKGELVSPDEYEIISRDTNTDRGRRTLVIRGKGQYGGTKKFTYLIQARGIYDNWTQEAVQILSDVLAIFG